MNAVSVNHVAMQVEDESALEARYLAAQALISMEPLVTNATVHPRWIDEHRFWYERRGESGVEYCIVDAAFGTRRVAFTKAAVAAALSKLRGIAVDLEVLILRRLTISRDLQAADFLVLGEHYSYGLKDGCLARKVPDRELGTRSPCGGYEVFVKDYNLWVCNRATGAERPLTGDGHEQYAYALAPSVKRQSFRERSHAPPPEGIWSPDGRYFLTLQVDERHVPEMPLMRFVPDEGLRPQVTQTRMCLPTDARVTTFRVLAIDVQDGREVAAEYRELVAVRMNDTPFSAGLAWWRADSRIAYFVDIERLEKHAHVVEFDVGTGSTRVVFTEASDSYVELSVNVTTSALVRYLRDTGELIWYSERTGHGHLYLYSLASGKLECAITSGPWQVREIHHVDAQRREVLLSVGGLVPHEDPYLRKPCLGFLDGRQPRPLSDEPGDHIIWQPGDFDLTMLGLHGGDQRAVSGTSPTGTYFVETIGMPDKLPRTFVRRRDGKQVMPLEQAEDRALPPSWTWPEPVKLKADDGVTDIYGLLFKPWNHEPSGSYPVIDYLYGGPQTYHVPKAAFAQPYAVAHGDREYLEAAQFAAIGAFVVLIDGRGTAGRERDFREASHGAVHTASNLQDHIAGIRQLSRAHPTMDLQRVGVCGFSAGAYLAVHAIFHHGDFFKVAVANSGNYDQRLFWHCWGERYHGPFQSDHYAVQAAKSHVAGFTGKLLLMHGLLDTACHPAALFQLLQELIDSNKDVDLVLLPRARHDITGYGLRRRLDYFTTHLLSLKPPEGIVMTSVLESMMKQQAADAAIQQGSSSQHADSH